MTVESDSQTPPIDRRALLAGGGAALAGLLGFAGVREMTASRSRVFLAGAQSYAGDLARTIRDGLAAVEMNVGSLAGKSVLLKPNMVEPTRAAPHMTTNPAVLRAAAEVFRGFGARVVVGEGPGHVRDTDHALYGARLDEVIRDERLPFADLNYEAVAWRDNGGRASKLKGFHFPQSVLEADLIVSMPKLKTHHWVGVTAGMKNLYGTIPGCVYGWPKNVLHYAGIPESVFDINASLPSAIVIVDGIECMQGDGPIMGSPKDLGMIAVGTNPAAVDATCARIIGLDPHRIRYLQLASGKLGPIHDRWIEQRGESWESLKSPFELIDWPHIQKMKAQGGALVS